MKQNANWIIFVVWQREGLELSFHKLVKLSGLEKLWVRHGAKTHKGKKKKFCYSKVWQMFTFTNGDFILSLKNDATIKTGGKDKRGIFVKTNRDNRSKLANDEVWQLKIHLVSTEFSLQTFLKLVYSRSKWMLWHLIQVIYQASSREKRQISQYAKKLWTSWTSQFIGQAGASWKMNISDQFFKGLKYVENCWQLQKRSRFASSIRLSLFFLFAEQ